MESSAIFYILSSILLLCQPAVITVPPVSVTAPPFTTARFTCEGTGDILNWWIQSALLTDSIAKQRQITVATTVNNTNFSSVLTINASADLGISCEVLSLNPFGRVISNCELTVKGVSPVGNIQHNFTSDNSLLITWSLPAYYSNDVPFGSSVSYRVLVIDEEDGDIILDTTISNTNIEVDNVTKCDTFNVSVIALWDQYTSINTVSNNGSYSITVYDTRPLIPSISFELDCPLSKCLVSLMDGSTEVTDIINETDHIIEFKLSPFRHYELTAVVKNLVGETRAAYTTSISTFHTQDIIINSSYTNGSVSVQCVFVSGSTADGCHVIFTDTSNGTAVLNVLLSLVQEPTLVTLPAGNYTVTAYDNINGSLYGPAFYYPTPVEIIKIMSPTSSSSTHESISSTASSEIILTPTSFTTFPTLGTENTSSTSGTINDANIVVPIVAGTASGIVLLILIILAVCVGVTVYKRKRMKVQVLMRSEIATIQQPQAETNHYQDVHELRIEVPITTSPVQLTNNRPIYEEIPYHVTRSGFLPNYLTIPSPNVEGLMQQEPCPSITSMTTVTTQKTTLEDSVSSATSNNIHDNAYTTDPNATDIITVTVTDTSNNEATAVNDTAAMATVTDNTAHTVDPTYAVIDKRTDTIVPPAAAQTVEYDTVTGDINKRGGDITVYPPDDNSANPPPPSYADIIAQESGTTAVSGSQFVVPVSDDTAGADDKYEKYPPTYTGDEYGSKTPVLDQSHSTDDRRGALVPSNEDEDAVTHFEKTDSFEHSESSFEETKEGIGDEVVGVKRLSSTKIGKLITGFTSKAEVIATSHDVNEIEGSKGFQK